MRDQEWGEEKSEALKEIMANPVQKGLEFDMMVGEIQEVNPQKEFQVVQKRVPKL